MQTARLTTPIAGDRVAWGPSRATITRVRPGDHSSSGPHLDITYDSGRRDTVDRWCADRPELLIDEPAGARRALAIWLRAAADGADAPSVNVHDSIVARVLLGATTEADLSTLRDALRDVST